MSKIILTLGVFFLFHSLHAQTFNGTGGAIPDGGTQTCFNQTVSGVGVINGTYGLASVCLTINHPWISDLEIYLKAPDGTLVPLSIQNGADGVNYTNTCFTATAVTQIVNGTAPFTGTYLPEGSLASVNNGQNANGTWSLCIQDLFTLDAGSLVNWSLLFNNTPAQPLAVPSNDDPCNAIPLTSGSTCNYTTYTNAGATATAGVPAPGCANYSGSDVWFQVTVPAGGALNIDMQTGVMTDAGMAIYSGASCNALTLITCNDDGSNNGLMSLINATGLTPGTTIWIRVWEYGNDNNGTFGICVSTPVLPPPVTNDNPCNAIPLTSGSTCTYSTYTNIGATGTTGVPAPGCANYLGNDVWFQVTVPAAGALNIDMQTGIMTDGGMAIYSGSNCNSLTLITCNDDGSNNGLMPMISATGLTPGTTIWIRVWEYGNDNNGTFGICVTTPVPPPACASNPPAGNTCALATPICNFNGYCGNTSASYTADYWTELDNAFNTCLGGASIENNSFISFVASATSSTFNVWVTSSLYGDGIQMMFYSGGCGSGPVTCHGGYNNILPGGPNMITASGLTVGNTYYLMIDGYAGDVCNYTLDAASGVNALNVTPDAALICAGGSVSLTASGGNGVYAWSPATGLSSTSGTTVTASPATTTTYTVTSTGVGICPVTLTKQVTVTVSPIITPTFAAIPSICSGAAAPVLPTTSTNGINGTWNPATVSNIASGSYTFTPTAGQCANPTSIAVTVTGSSTVPSFAAVPPICSGSAAPVLPTTSTNGITGTWSPATVSNTATGTYTFTPTTGQCATNTTLTVTVNSVTPTFAVIPPICSGAPAPALPGISSNGITGTWSPAIVSNTTSGTYTFTPTAGQCATSTSINITVYELPTVYVHGTNPTCTGTCNGNATVDVTGGTSPYIYNWSNGGVTQTITGLCAGTYSVTVTDAHGCVAPAVSPVTNNCFQIQSTMVDACSATEYDQEMVFFQVGQNPLNTASLSVTWPTAADSWNGLCTNPAFISSVNSTITGGGVVLPLPANGILPANANVVLITSTPPTSASSFANLTDTLYAMFQCPGNTQGHFSNNTGTPGIRTLVMNFGAGCTDTTSYDTGLLINQNGTTGGNAALNNGAYVNYSASGTASYLNYGCIIPYTIQTAQVTLVAPLQVIPAFNAVPAICSGATAPVLPTTSTNGITGSWSPGTVNNTTTTTYTFTPTTGLCATTASLTVTVNLVVTSATNTTICNNQLPYTWNGQSYNTAGPHTVTLISSAGCDSIATLNLTVNPVVTSTTNTTICANQLPYSWNSQSYAGAGTYSVTLTSSAGCDSIVTLNLTVNPVVTSTTNTSICANQLPYSWNSQSYAGAGTYSVTLTSSAGCDSIATLNLTVNPVVTSTTNTTICADQLPYSWNSQSYAGAGTYSVTLTSSAGCDSIATLNLTVNPVVTSTTNTTICANQLPYSWNSQSYAGAGTYSVTLTSSAGCDSIATLNLTVNPVVTSTTNITICSNQLPYTWNSQSYAGAGTYSVTLTSSAGCDSIATLNLTVNPVVTSTTNTTICANQLPYSWNSQSYAGAGTYSVTLTSSAGCDSIATLNLIVNPVVASTTNTTICANQLPYSWNSQSYAGAGTYSVTLTSSAGCDSIATLNLTVNPVVTSTTNTTICSNQLPYTWNGQSYNTAGPHTVTLISSAGCDSIATLNLTVNPVVTSTTNTTICSDQLPYSWNSQSYAGAGTYSVTLTSSAGCDSIATLNLIVNPVVTSTTNTAICSNQLPYTWNSQSYAGAGTYSVTLTSSAGCDSIATLNLTVNPVVTSTTNTTICSNQLPYTWNSQSYAGAGTYSVTLTSSAGCDSIATLNLTVNPVVTSTTNTTICANQLPYSWNSQSYAGAGTYSVTLTSSAGCDSIVNLNLTVNPVVTSTTNTTICSNQLPYTWNGQSYNTAGSHTVTLISSAGCDSIANLNLTVNPVVTSTTNTSICANQLPYSWNSQSYAGAGSYSVTLTSSAGCDSIATLNLTVNPVVTSTTNTTICANQLPYSWNSQSYAGAGTYSVTLTSSAGCDSIATLNLTVNPVVTSTTNTTICANQLPYSWNSQSYAGAGTYSVTLTSSAGCDSIATLNLTVNPVVTSTTNTSICANQLPYSWNSQSYAGAGTYSVTLTSSAGCDSIATLNLTVNPVVISTTNTSICANQLPYSWNSQSYAGAGTYSVTLTSSAGCDSIATLNLTVNPVVTSTTNISICANQLPYSWNSQSYAGAGTYSVTLTSNAGCDSIATLNLTVNPVVTSTTNTSICANQLPYSWNSQSYAGAGTYSVTLTSSAGCDSIATLNLTVNPVMTSTTNISICANQLPYSWNSQSYAGAGTYSVTLTSSAGCDSIATLNLTVNPVVTSTTNITICSNQLPYTWNSQSYAGAGTYSVTLTSSAGCDSIATLNLTVNPVVTSTTNTTICANQLPYSWNSQSYAGAGTYSVTLTSNAGCDSIATLNLTVNPVVTSTTNTTICAIQLPYSWNSQSYAGAGTYSVTLTSSAGCDSIATLNLTVNPVVTSTTNTTICANQLPYSWNSQSYAGAGTYSVTLTSSAGCDSIATLNLTVNPVVTSTTNTSICANQLPYSWNSQSYAGAGTYSVTLTSTSGCDSIATLNLTVNSTLTSSTDVTICTNQLPYSWNSQSYAGAGTYSITLTSTSGCDSIATLNLTVNPVVTSTTSTAICSNQLPYTWNGQSYNTAGAYTVTLISSAGCDSIATLNLTVNPVVTSTTNTTICSNQLPYIWNGQSYNTAGAYTFTLISSAGCDSIATLNLTVNPVVTSTTNTSICANQLPYSWNSQSYAGAGTYSVTLTSTSGCDSIATLNLTVNSTLTSSTDVTICTNQLPYSWNSQSYNAAGSYSVTLTSTSGCDSIATLNLTVNSTLTSSTDVTICTNQLPYSWNSQSYNAAGTYSVTLTSTSGCDSIATLNLTVNSTLTSSTDVTICTNQLPYSWNSQSYNAAGSYSVTLTSTSGCDSIATLNLTVNSTLTSSTDVTICTNQLPYSWNSQSYAGSGTYSVTLTSTSGCDSIATLNLTVNSTLTSSTDVTICTNQLPYSWNSQSYAGAGTYSVTLTSTSGCDSIATLNLTVNSTLTSSTDVTICSNQLPYSWNSQSYNAAGSYSVTLTSTSGCDSIATLNLTVNSTLTSSTDVTICTNQLPYSWNSQIYNAAGTYSVTLTSTSGCDSIATLNLTVNSTLTGSTDITICSNQLPYSWNSQSYNAAGSYSVTLTSSAGCDSIATLNLTVNSTLTSSTDITICTNQLPYSWNSQSYAGAGTYSVTLTSTSGCDSIATLNLTVNSTFTSSTDVTICTNQLPYSWNSQSYNAAGSYSVTLTSSAGCDSIATLNLTVNPVVTSTTNTTICANQLPYSWNSQSYADAGTYSVTLTSTSGCDSIATLNLTVNSTLTGSTDITICSNQLPYSWNSQSYNAAGSYSVTLTSTSGCDSIATLNLTLNPVVTSTTSTAICSNQLPYTWNGQSYNTAGPHTVTLISSAGCDSVATLNLTVNPVVTSITNTTICANQLPYSWNSQSYNAAGSYSVTLTSSAGCDSIATLNLTVNSTLTSSTDVTICTNQLPYSWNNQSYAGAGTYSVTLTSSAGCDSIATLNLTVNSTLTGSTDITICSNQLPYSWNSQSYNAAGSYSVTLTSSAGCDSIATLNLTVNSTLTSSTDITICTNQLPYSWNSQSYAGAGTYSVTLTSTSGCDSIATLNLTVNSTFTSSTDVTICTNQLPYSWNSQSYNAAGSYSVTLTSSAGCDSIATLNLTVNPVVTSTTNTSICANQLPYSWNSQSYAGAGTYSVTLTSTSGCDSIATLNLTVNSTLTSSTDVTICTNQLPYSWNSQNYNAAGTYSVTLTSTSGCDSIATLNLTVNSTLTSSTDVTICTNQLPYSWNSQSYNAAGSYSVTLTSTSGCDSIATLNLTVNSTLTSSTDVTICTNQLPYSWNSQSYNAAGSYSVTLTSTSGCDSIANLNLTVNSTLNSSTDITICTNQLPYSWNSQSYNAAGSYSVTLTSTSGCDSIATLNLTVNSTLTSSTDVTICTNQLPYSWNSQSYAGSGTYSVTLTSTSGCDSIATLNLTVNSTLTSSTDVTICTNQLPYSWNSQSYAGAGTYSVTLTSTSGCDSIATLNLTVNSTLTSSTDVTICSNQLPYSWNSQSYNAAGSYSVTLTSTSGCDSIATLNLTVNSTLTSSTDVTICTNQLPYSWNSQIYNAAGTYSVTLTSTSGCDSIATLNLTVNSTLTSSTDVTICTNQLPYSWNSQSYNAGGSYSVTLTSTSGCDSIATLNLTVNSTLTSSTDVTICTNQLPYSWNSQSYAGAGTYSVTLTSSAGCDSIATLNLTVNSTLTSSTDITICTNQLPYSWNSQSYNAAGTYLVTLTSSAGCDSIATLNLTVNPVVTSTTNTTICANQLPYSWNSQSYAGAGSYSVTLTSTSGCDSIATLNLTVNSTLTSSTDVTICTNQLPYSWNSQSYAGAGTYSVTLMSTSGCDSIATLNLTVNSTLTSSTDVTICTNQLPYSWNSQSYNAAGSFTVTLTSSAGCDSIATLNLTVNPVVSSTTLTNICSNQLPYSWNGQLFTTSGPHAVTLTSSDGCDSIATLNLVINPVVTSTTSASICSNQLPYTWNGQLFTTAGLHAVTLASTTGCDSIATLNLAVSEVSGSTTNINTCSNQLPYVWNGNNYSTGGSYSITLTGNNGCDSVAILHLTVNPVVTSTTNSSTCNNQLPYAWNGQTYSSAGNYSVTLTSSAGCDSIATLVLTVNPVVSGNTNASVCSGQLPYIWNGQAYNTAGTHSITLTSSAGCDSVATLQLTINPTPPSPVVNTPVNYCQFSTSTALTASGNYPLIWYSSATGGTGAPAAPIPSTLTPGIFHYFVSQVNNGCESPRQNITVRINRKPVLGNDREIKICFGSSADLTTLYNTNGLNSNWTNNNVPVNNPSNVTVSGNYTLITTNPAGCADTAKVTLIIQPEVIANAGNDDNAEYNYPYQLHGSGGGLYQWTPGTPLLNNPIIANPLATLTDDTEFILMVQDEIGCKDYDTVKLRVLNGPTFYIPNAFTPNGDGLNDIFRPTPVGIAKLEYFRVFNRYGELVYETHDISQGWDGTYKGKKQDLDNYVWVLRGIDRKGQLKQLKGNVVLVR